MNRTEKLLEYVASKIDEPFEWGTADCCVFAGGAVEVMTGNNPLDPFTVKYGDEKTGRALLHRYGGLARILTDLCGRIRQDGKLGDLAYSNFPDGSAVGVHMGTKAVFKGQDGLVEVELIKCRFFKVPDVESCW